MDFMKQVVIFFCVWVADVSGQTQTKISFQKDLHDFGIISESGGNVSHTFVFRNITEQTVEIKDVETSCGCTVTEWTNEPVKPGKEGQIEVLFNPSGRPGFFRKSIQVTFLPGSVIAILQVSGQVMEKSKPPKEIFDHRDGQLMTRSSGFNLGKVYINQESVTQNFNLYNNGSTILKINGADFAEHLTVKFPKEIKPGDTGVLSIKYNPSKKTVFGLLTEQLELFTSDAENPVKYFSVIATIEEFFPVISPELLDRAPRMDLSVSEIKFQTLKQEIIFEKEISFRNTGKATLKIRSIVPNCTCISAFTDSDEVLPGNSGKIRIRFNPAGRPGRQIKSLMIYSNDPQHPMQRITLNGLVAE